MNLDSIRTPEGIFTIAPFDHRGSLAEMFDTDVRTPAGKELVTQLKILFMDAFSELCSGVLVDPEFGFPAIEHKAKNCGLILTLEASDYSGDRSMVPTLIPNWSVRHIKNNFAVAKLLLYYHPQEATAEKKKKLVIELGEYCKYENVSFLLEPVLYNPKEKKELPPAEFQEAQLTACQEFQKHCDVLKIQYPGDPLACATLTAELDIPWILLSRGMPYEPFKEALKVCMENGAKGFAAGRAIWQEIGKCRLESGAADLQAINKFLQTTGRERLKALIEIATTKNPGI
jgi:tagatose-1,6-bisphosphate aldolase